MNKIIRQVTKGQRVVISNEEDFKFVETADDAEASLMSASKRYRDVG